MNAGKYAQILDFLKTQIPPSPADLLFSNLENFKALAKKYKIQNGTLITPV